MRISDGKAHYPTFWTVTSIHLISPGRAGTNLKLGDRQICLVTGRTSYDGHEAPNVCHSSRQCTFRAERGTPHAVLSADVAALRLGSTVFSWCRQAVQLLELVCTCSQVVHGFRTRASRPSRSWTRRAGVRNRACPSVSCLPQQLSAACNDCVWSRTYQCMSHGTNSEHSGDEMLGHAAQGWTFAPHL